MLQKKFHLCEQKFTSLRQLWLGKHYNYVRKRPVIFYNYESRRVRVYVRKIMPSLCNHASRQIASVWAKSQFSSATMFQEERCAEQLHLPFFSSFLWSGLYWDLPRSTYPCICIMWKLGKMQRVIQKEYISKSIYMECYYGSSCEVEF